MKYCLFGALALFLLWVVMSLLLLWGVVLGIGFWKMTFTVVLLIAALIAVHMVLEQYYENQELKKQRFLD